MCARGDPRVTCAVQVGSAEQITDVFRDRDGAPTLDAATLLAAHA